MLLRVTALRHVRVLLLVAVAAVLAGCSNEELPVLDFDGDCEGLGGPAALVGLRADSGDFVWERTIGDATGIALTDGVAAAAGRSGAAVGVDAGSGDLLWCHDLGQVSIEGSIVSPGFAASAGVFATMVAEGDAVALDPRSGQELWRTPIGVAEGAHVRSGNGVFEVHSAAADQSYMFSLDPTTGSRVEAGPALSADDELRVVVAHPRIEGMQLSDVTVMQGDLELWQERLPGFVVELYGDAVVVIDQTGGTGDITGERADTRASTYEASTGAPRWQMELPGSPHLIAEAGSSLVIPNATTLDAIDATTGGIVWETDLGSPGRGGRYSTPGTYRFVQPADEVTDQVLVGLIVADEPYRD